jgi:hypothetical protein
MPTCSADHASSMDGYCELCGAPIGTPSSVPERRRDLSDRSSRTELVAPPAAASPCSDLCPACTKPRATDDRFCEGCGHEFDVPGAPSGLWVAEVIADRAYYERIVSGRTVPEGQVLPANRRASVVALESEEVTIGRRADSTVACPDIDLSGPLDDPCVSRHHAQLVRREDGHYEVIDTGSTNGTRVNYEMTALEAYSPLPLSDGDRIHVGAWTTITFRGCPRP